MPGTPEAGSVGLVSTRTVRLFSAEDPRELLFYLVNLRLDPA